MRLSHCFFAGVPTDTDWSQSYAHQGEQGHFGLVVHVGGQSDQASLGKQVLSQAMEAAGKLTREEFLTFFKSWEKPGVDICAIFSQEDKALLYAHGEVAIALARKGTQQTILRGSNSAQFIEGQSQPGDYYTLGTNEFFSNLPAVDPNRSTQDACDVSVASLYKLPDSSKVTALFIKAAGGSETKEAGLPPHLSDTSRVSESKAAGSASSFGRPKFPKVVFASNLLSQKGKKLLKIGLALGAVVLLFLILSWYLTARKAADLEKTLAPYQQRYDQLSALPQEKKLDKLQGLRELSRDLTDRQQQTREASLKRAFEQLLVLVNRAFAEASGEKHFDKLNVFYDFRLIAPDFVATAVGFDAPGKLAVFLDGGHSRLLSLSLEKKEALTLSVDEKLSRPFALAVENRKAYVLASEGVMELSLPLDRLGSVVVPRDGVWVNPKLIDVFGTNAYILDTLARNILKYDLTDLGSSPSGWLRSKEGIDFERVTSMRIDGGVWLGDNGGSVTRFMQGMPEEFSYQNVLDKPTSSVYIYATKDSDFLYILEPQAKRLLVLNKQGEYQKSLTSDDLGTATGVIVDESINKAYILSGSLVYEVGL